MCISTSGIDLELNRTHKYYYQVQGLLNICGLQWCDFVLRTQKDLFVERVLIDKDLWANKMYPKLCKFYNKALLPELALPRLTQGGIREPGKWV